MALTSRLEAEAVCPVADGKASVRRSPLSVDARKGLVDWRANMLTVAFVFAGATVGVARVSPSPLNPTKDAVKKLPVPGPKKPS